jgi:exosortase
MSIRPHASWFPWLLFALITLHAAARYTIYDPSFGNNDSSLLFVIIALVLWIERNSIISSLSGEGTGDLLTGSAFLIAGWVLYIVGRLYPVMILEIWGLFFMAAGLVAALAPREYRKSAFFMVVAGTVIVVIGWVAPDLFSSQLALAIAATSAKVISATLFPVISDGVILYFGPYSAEVTKACSGMNSIFSLTALSVLYLRQGVKREPWHIAVLVACVLPVALLTNLFRVITLVLATQYVGDAFSQGLFHNATGIFVFIVALAALALIDYLLFNAYSGKKQTEIIAHAPNKV